MIDSNPTRENVLMIMILDSAVKECEKLILYFGCKVVVSKKMDYKNLKFKIMADREGFEPSVILTTTRP